MYNANTSQYIRHQYCSDRKSVTIQPTSPLLASTQYCYVVSGAYDSGNAVYSGPCFITGLGADTTPPVISLMNPPNGTTTAINVTLEFYASKTDRSADVPSTAVLLTTTIGNLLLAQSHSPPTCRPLLSSRPRISLRAQAIRSISADSPTSQGTRLLRLPGNSPPTRQASRCTTAPSRRRFRANQATGTD